jgi:hypothetical protein
MKNSSLKVMNYSKEVLSHPLDISEIFHDSDFFPSVARTCCFVCEIFRQVGWTSSYGSELFHSILNFSSLHD